MSNPSKTQRRRKPPTATEALYAVENSLDEYVDTNPFTLVPTIEDVCVGLVDIAEKIRAVQGNEEIRISIAKSLRKLVNALKSLSDLARDKAEHSFRIFQLDEKIKEDPQLQATVQTLITRLQTIDLQAGPESTLQNVLDGLDEAGESFETCSRADIERITDNVLSDPMAMWTRSHGRLSSYDRKILSQDHQDAEWLFEHPEYRSWRSECPVLWIHGKVATGKTYLASAFVKKMLLTGLAMTFYFGDMFNKDTRKASEAMRILFSRIPGMAMNDYSPNVPDQDDLDHRTRRRAAPYRVERAISTKGTLDVQKLVEIFLSFLCSNDSVIVVDAVDECSDGDNLLDVLLSLVEKAKPDSNIRLLVTSRDDNDTIRRRMSQYLHICLDKDGPDDLETLRTQINYAFQRWPVICELPTDLRGSLVEVLTNCDHGSYRWIRRQHNAVDRAQVDPLAVIFSSIYTVRWMKRLTNKEAKWLIEALYHWTSKMDKLSTQYSNSLFRVLRKLCKAYGILPQGVYLNLQERTIKDLAERAEGGSAVVSAGRYRTTLVACKRLKGDPRVSMSNICREVIVWKHLQHPNIMPLLGVAEINGIRYIISEWMAYGNVRKYLDLQEVSIKKRRELVIDSVAGMEYLHSKDIIHGDLKASNVLIDNGGRARITDFGLTAVQYGLRSINVATDLPKSGLYGTAQWIPPEYLDSENAGISFAIKEGDVYSLGGVIWEIFTGQDPFPGLAEATVCMLVLQGQHPQRTLEASARGISDKVWEILTRCWSMNRTKRPYMSVLLAELQAEFRTPSRPPM